MKFLESLTSKFVEKYAVVPNAKSLNPEIMCMTPEKGTKLFKSLVDNLVQLDRVTPKEADGIYAEYKRYLDGCNKKPSTVSEVQQKRKRT